MSATSWDEWAAGVVATLTEQVQAGPAGSWSMPWHRMGGDLFAPRNETTGAAYQGINVWQLAGRAMTAGYASGMWATYKQWAALKGADGENGCQVRKGEKGTSCVRWVAVERKVNAPNDPRADEDGKLTTSGMTPRFFVVFAREQVDNVPALIDNPLSETERVDQVEQVLAAVGATVSHGGDRAFYSPGSDSITLPAFGAFKSALDYYSTSAHEHTHWTGHKSRCARDLSGRFGDSSYALEELVAEMGSCLLMAHFGLSATPRPDHAQYVASWLKAISDQPKALVAAAKMSSDAVSWIIKRADAASATAPAWAPPVLVTA